MFLFEIPVAILWGLVLWIGLSLLPRGRVGIAFPLAVAAGLMLLRPGPDALRPGPGGAPDGDTWLAMFGWLLATCGAVGAAAAALAQGLRAAFGLRRWRYFLAVLASGAAATVAATSYWLG